jgi:hypothetical protein
LLDTRDGKAAVKRNFCIIFYDMKCVTLLSLLQLDTHDGKAAGEGMLLVIVQI